MRINLKNRLFVKIHMSNLGKWLRLSCFLILVVCFFYLISKKLPLKENFSILKRNKKEPTVLKLKHHQLQKFISLDIQLPIINGIIPPRGFYFSPDTTKIALTLPGDPTLHLFDTSNGKLLSNKLKLESYIQPYLVLEAFWSPDSKGLALRNQRIRPDYSVGQDDLTWFSIEDVTNPTFLCSTLGGFYAQQNSSIQDTFALGLSGAILFYTMSPGERISSFCKLYQQRHKAKGIQIPIQQGFISSLILSPRDYNTLYFTTNQPAVFGTIDLTSKKEKAFSLPSCLNPTQNHIANLFISQDGVFATFLFCSKHYLFHLDSKSLSELWPHYTSKLALSPDHQNLLEVLPNGTLVKHHLWFDDNETLL